jgi:hypothetical protein
VVAVALAVQQAALADRQLVAQAALQTQQVLTRLQIRAAAVAGRAVTTRQAATAAAELSMSGLRFNYGTIFCTT